MKLAPPGDRRRAAVAAGAVAAALAASFFWPRQPDLAGDMFDAWKTIQRGGGPTAPIYAGERRLSEDQRRAALRVLHRIAGEFQTVELVRPHRFPESQGALIRFESGGRRHESGLTVFQYGRESALMFEQMLPVAIRLRWMKDEGRTEEDRRQHYIRTIREHLPDLQDIGATRLVFNQVTFPTWASYLDGLERAPADGSGDRAVDQSSNFVPGPSPNR